LSAGKYTTLLILKAIGLLIYCIELVEIYLVLCAKITTQLVHQQQYVESYQDVLQ